MESDPLKAPPVLNDDIAYTDWKFDLSMWEMYTKVEAKHKRSCGVSVSKWKSKKESTSS